MSNAQHLVHFAHLYKEIKLFGDGPKARELSDIIKEHALLGVGAALIPIGGLDLAALAANTWTMYIRINKTVGVDFKENALKTIASGIIANVATAVPTLGLGMLAQSVLKYIPGLGTAGGMALGAMVNVALMYTAGKVYLKALEKLLHSDTPLTEDAIAAAAKEAVKDKSFVSEAYQEGKSLSKE